jgi:hypothetical protein
LDLLATKSIPKFTAEMEIPGVQPMGMGAEFGDRLGGQVIVYGGLHLHDVQDRESLIEELGELST